jgi:hypothetical protein
MAFSDAQKAKIQAAMSRKLGNMMLSCALCHFFPLSLADNYGAILSINDPKNLDLGSTFPGVVLVCGRCGNTHVLNIGALGLSDLGPAETKRP